MKTFPSIAVFHFSALKDCLKTAPFSQTFTRQEHPTDRFILMKATLKVGATSQLPVVSELTISLSPIP